MAPNIDHTERGSSTPEGGARRALIVGVSTGLGNALALRLLARGCEVCGVGRSMPSNIPAGSRFRFAHLDLLDPSGIASALEAFLFARVPVTRFDYVFLNAGRFSQRIAPMADVAVSDLKTLMQMNVWGHKAVLDALLAHRVAIDTVIFSASIAGVRPRAGNSGYAMSKAALNMMAKLYALENPGIFFSVPGMCNVDTHLSQTIGTLPIEGDFPEISQLRARAHEIAGYVVSAEQRAKNVLDLLESNLKRTSASSDFVEIRSLL